MTLVVVSRATSLLHSRDLFKIFNLKDRGKFCKVLNVLKKEKVEKLFFLTACK